MEAMLHSVMEAAREDLRHSLAKGTTSLDEQAPLTRKIEIAYRTLYLTEEALQEFHHEFEALMKRTASKAHPPTPNEKTYNFLYFHFPDGQ